MIEQGLARYLALRVARTLLVALLVAFVAFNLVTLIPGDPARKAAGEFATPEQVEQIRDDLRLDEPVLERFGSYVTGLVRGDLGTSVAIFPGKSVGSIITEVAPTTISLAFVTILLVVLTGFPAGVLAALRRDTWIDHTLGAVMTAALAIPTFVLGPILVILFSIDRSVFPALGYVPLAEGVGPWLHHLLLPAIALGSTPAAELARQTRASLVGELDESYIRTARSKGLRTGVILGKHAMKNAAVVSVTVLGLQVGRILGGSVVVEAVFGLPGLGSLAYTSVNRSDYPVVQALVLLTALVVLVSNFLVDLSYLYFNPKLRKAHVH